MNMFQQIQHTYLSPIHILYILFVSTITYYISDWSNTIADGVSEPVFILQYPTDLHGYMGNPPLRAFPSLRKALPTDTHEEE